jgi:hypothetical protein
MIMDTLFAEWDADRGRPAAEVTGWAESELDRVFAEQAAATRDAGAGGAA